MNLPCKHILFVATRTRLSWEDLPQEFRNHALLTLDSVVLQACHQATVPPDVPTGLPTKAPDRVDPESVVIPEHMPSRKDEDSRIRAIEATARIRSLLTYNFPSDVLARVLVLLHDTEDQLSASAPRNTSFPLRSLSLKRANKEMCALASKRLPEIPAPKKRKRARQG